MTFDYTNVLRDHFLEPFREIFRQQFIAIKMYMDNDFQERGSKWLNLNTLVEDNMDMRSNGQIREYSATLRYYQHLRPERDRDWYKVMTNTAEKMKRLIGNNSNFTVLGTWVNEGGTWGETSTVWSADRDTYCWHDLKTSINYNPDRGEAEEDKKLAIIEFGLTFKIEEVY